MRPSYPEDERCAVFALGIERRSRWLSKMLLNEIDRAEIHARDTLPPDVVSLGSDVEFLDVATGATRQVRLVLPPDADIEAGRVSILTPMGAGLIGLRKGQSIDWPCYRSEEHTSELPSLMPHP